VPYLLRFLAIGTFVAGVEIGTLDLLLHLGCTLFIATTLSYLVAVTCHFTLNKYVNFRDFRRSSLAQLRTYATVVTFQYLLQLLVVEVGVHSGLRADVSKAIGIVINIPVGFICHRYLTFGHGIFATLRRLLAPVQR
jgi:putative flippase GtrA